MVRVTAPHARCTQAEESAEGLLARGHAEIATLRAAGRKLTQEDLRPAAEAFVKVMTVYPGLRARATAGLATAALLQEPDGHEIARELVESIRGP